MRRGLARFARAALVAAAVLVTAPTSIDTSSGARNLPPIHGLDEHGNLTTFRRSYGDLLQDRPGLVREVSVSYVANNGARRTALVVLPRWYGQGRNPALPLVISPHGRGVKASANLRFWRALPAFGPFVLVSPEGQGRRLRLYSWGWRGQIDDLARMPTVLGRVLPWLRIDPQRVYAVGSSMGGQETLLLVARHPGLLAGAAALDSATDMAARYRAFPGLQGGAALQRRAREEIGGTPQTAAPAYAARSPISWARQIATSRVPLQIWWSTRDKIVTNQKDESGRMYRLIKATDPSAPVTQYVGSWQHSQEFHDVRRLPLALVRLGLIELSSEIPRGLVK